MESLRGEIVLEHDTGEWSVDIGFPQHRVAIEVCEIFVAFCIPLDPVGQMTCYP